MLLHEQEKLTITCKKNKKKKLAIDYRNKSKSSTHGQVLIKPMEHPRCILMLFYSNFYAAPLFFVFEILNIISGRSKT